MRSLTIKILNNTLKNRLDYLRLIIICEAIKRTRPHLVKLNTLEQTKYILHKQVMIIAWTNLLILLFNELVR